MKGPSDLNDPWESKRHILVGDLADPRNQARYIALAFKMMMSAKPKQNPQKVRSWLESHNQEQAEDLARQLRDNYQGSLEGYRMCSFITLTGDRLKRRKARFHRLSFNTKRPDIG